ncbi:class I SAM-dependent methyltransferase [[Eubacterium] cellulosolvens]
MKRKPFPFEKVIDDPDYAKTYTKRNEKRNRKITKTVIIKNLNEFGFKTGTILDAGCGAGEVCIELAHGFPEAKIVGIDLGEPLLKMARDGAKEEGVEKQVTFKKGDVTKIPFPDDSFNVVVSINVFHILDDPIQMLNEIERVLAPEGQLLILCIRRSWIGHILPIFKTAYTAPEVLEIVKRSKLRKSEVSETFWAWGIVVPGLHNKD